jgi:iron complex outermembrane receptor protein
MRAKPILTPTICSTLALALGIVAAPALAQETGIPAGEAPVQPPAAEAADASGDIIVTAQRRTERLQDVPIAISALGADALENRNIETVYDLQGTVPGLSISGFAGVNSTNLISLRGIAGQPVPIGASQATAVYLDGVYLSKPDAAFFGLQDIERVEVLRGPQGTLYGRNATAGAINIVTHTPGQTFEGKIDASYGNYNSYTVGGFISGPVGRGFSASLSGSANGRDGFFRNTVTGNRLGDTSSVTGRAKLVYDNDAGFDATLSADITSKRSEDLFTLATLSDGEVAFSRKFVTTNLEDQIRTRLKTGGVGLTINAEASDDFTVTSISSYRKFDFFTVYDIDATAALSIQPAFINKNETFNQEVRGVYNSGPLRFTIGGNYYNEKAEVFLRVNPAAYTKGALRADPRPHAKSDLSALAAFGQFEYDLTDTLTAVAGARLNYEKRDFSIDYSTAGAPGAFPPIIGKVSDTAVLPSFGVNWKVDPNVLLYAKASLGYQSPGFAYQPGAGGALNTFGAEKLWAYEAGIKSQFLDRRVTLNVAGFYYDYSDLQLRRLITSLISRIENAGAARVTGVEGDLTIIPFDGLTLTAQATYSNGKYTDFCEGITTGTPQNNDPVCTGTPGPTADRAGNKLNQAPLWSGGASATYVGRLGDAADLKLNVNYAWESNSFFTAANEGLVSTGGWHRLGARAGVELGNGVELYAFGRNILNNRNIVMAFRFGGNVSAVVSDPATWGAGASFKF